MLCSDRAELSPVLSEPLLTVLPAVHHNGSLGQPCRARGVDVEEFIWGTMRRQGHIPNLGAI